jgi:hypothetical protein
MHIGKTTGQQAERQWGCSITTLCSVIKGIRGLLLTLSSGGSISISHLRDACVPASGVFGDQVDDVAADW